MMTEEEWENPFSVVEEPLLIEPKPPEQAPAPSLVVLGRFQPFHRGHAKLVDAALDYANGIGLSSRIVIGSANLPESLDNPWTWQERKQMICCWLATNHPNVEVDVVAVPDINDPPNWVAHAEQYHGSAGILFTSDEQTADLYRNSDWQVVESPLQVRESWEGWRIRSTLKMLSTVSEKEASMSVMAASIPEEVAELLWDEIWLKRLAFLGRPYEAVG
jgi:nicotinamide mononucleotide adenylyltransferase